MGNKNNNGGRMRCSFRGSFKKPDILPAPCLYLYTLLMFAMNNPGNFQPNSSEHRINTWNNPQLHRPAVYLTCVQKGDFYSCIKVFNNLLPHILKLKNKTQKFKASVWEYLITHTFYCWWVFPTVKTLPSVVTQTTE
jgi:hypothetical protein